MLLWSLLPLLLHFFLNLLFDRSEGMMRVNYWVIARFSSRLLILLLLLLGRSYYLHFFFDNLLLPWWLLILLFTFLQYMALIFLH